MKKFYFIAAVCFCSIVCHSQPVISFASDFSVLRNFKPGQKFWSIGQNMKADVAVTQKNGVYFHYCYYSPGKFRNELVAIAKSTATTPQEIHFINRAEMRINEFSVGWKHFLKGRNDADEGWSLYTAIGFGLMFGRAQNRYSVGIDTSLYYLPERPLNATGRFKRLTLDAALGYEYPIALEIYVYTEGKVSVPTTEYPSKYLLSNNNAPFPAMLSLGMRIIF